MSLTAPISVVIASKNRAQDILRCLEGLRTSSAAPSQIIVVDQSETRYVLPEMDGLLHIYAPSLSGLAQARNAAIAHITAPATFFIDDDVVVEHACLDKLSDAFATNYDTVGFQCIDLEPHEEGAFDERTLEYLRTRFFCKAAFHA